MLITYRATGELICVICLQLFSSRTKLKEHMTEYWPDFQLYLLGYNKSVFTDAVDHTKESKKPKVVNSLENQLRIQSGLDPKIESDLDLFTKSIVFEDKCLKDIQENSQPILSIVDDFYCQMNVV